MKFFCYNDLDPVKAVECRDENLLLTTLLSPMFQSVKKLKTHFHSNTILRMSQFYNQLRELEELTCFHNVYYDTVNWVSRGITIILNLPNLRKLIVQSEDGSYFDLRTPCLTYLEVTCLSWCALSTIRTD